MPKEEWGVKRTCLTCATRFYDLRRDPIICPNCGAEFDLTAAQKARRAKAEPVKAAKATAKVAEVDDDEDLIDDEDDEEEDEPVVAVEEVVDDDEESDDDADGPKTSDDVTDDSDGDETADDEEDIEDFDDDVLLEDDDETEDDDDLDLDVGKRPGTDD